MIPTPTSLTAVIGLVGVLIGILLRPIIEEFFARRRKSIRVLLEKDQVMFSTIGNQNIQISLNGSPIDRLFQRSIQVRNITGRTLRGFCLHFSLIKEHGIADRKSYVKLESTDGAEFKEISQKGDDGPFSFSIERLDRGATISGFFVATYLGNLRCHADSDYEVYIVDKQKFSYIGNWIALILTLILILIADISRSLFHFF